MTPPVMLPPMTTKLSGSPASSASNTADHDSPMSSGGANDRSNARAENGYSSARAATVACCRHCASPVCSPASGARGQKTSERLRHGKSTRPSPGSCGQYGAAALGAVAAQESASESGGKGGDAAGGAAGGGNAGSGAADADGDGGVSGAAGAEGGGGSGAAGAEGGGGGGASGNATGVDGENGAPGNGE